MVVVLSRNVHTTLLLILASVCSILSAVLLIFPDEHSNYFTFVFPSLILGAIGAEWTLHVAVVSPWSTSAGIIADNMAAISDVYRPDPQTRHGHSRFAHGR